LQGIRRAPDRANEPGSLFLTEKLFRSSTTCASEAYEVRLRFAGFVRCDGHDDAAAKADGILTGVEGIKQKLLISRHLPCSAVVRSS
jgi:hypothetical protein